MHIAVLLAMVIVVAVLVYTLIRLGRNDYTQLANGMAKRSRGSFEVLRPCPLCGTMLRRGETVHSVVFSGDSGAAASPDSPTRKRPEDHLAHLFGCPYCYPANDEHRRVCPVCRKEIPADGYVIARMFEKPGRKHVHVLGCTVCRVGRKP
jgi:hypothetical protein